MRHTLCPVKMFAWDAFWSLSGLFALWWNLLYLISKHTCAAPGYSHSCEIKLGDPRETQTRCAVAHCVTATLKQVSPCGGGWEKLSMKVSPWWSSMSNCEWIRVNEIKSIASPPLFALAEGSDVLLGHNIFTSLSEAKCRDACISHSEVQLSISPQSLPILCISCWTKHEYQR